MRVLLLMVAMLATDTHPIEAFVVPKTSQKIIRTTKTRKTSSSSSSSSLWGAERTTETETKTAGAETKAKADPLDELDARVLREMLSSEKGKLDTQTEEGMKKLLERGIKKTTFDPTPKQQQQDGNEDDGSYSSTVIKTITESGFWKSLERQAQDVLDSAKIFISNRVQRDSKLMASVGLFVFERIQYDIARALPEAASIPRKGLLKLMSSSSYSNSTTEFSTTTTTPEEEWQSVTESLSEIFQSSSDDTSSDSRIKIGSSSGRSLRTVAPAGRKSLGERQRRAFDSAQKKRQQEKNVANVGSKVSNSLYEVTREWEYADNKPGYRAIPFKNAIKGVAMATLEGAKETFRLQRAKANILIGATSDIDNFGSGRRKAALQEATADADTGTGAATTASTEETVQENTGIDVSLLEEEAIETEGQVVEDAFPTFLEMLTFESLRQEKEALLYRLRQCLDTPEDTWLSADVNLSNDSQVNDWTIREVVVAMIMFRDYLEVQDDDQEELAATATYLDIMNEFQRLQQEIIRISDIVRSSVGSEGAAKLIWMLEGESTVLSELDQLIFQYNKYSELQQEQAIQGHQEMQGQPNGEQMDFAYSTEVADNSLDAPNEEQKVGPYFASTVTAEQEPELRPPKANNMIVVEPDILERANNGATVAEVIVEDNEALDVNGDNHYENVAEAVDNEDFEDGSQVMVEVISDEHFDETALNTAKKVEAAPEENRQDDKEDVVSAVALRSLDLAFFVAEKAVTVGVPKVVKTGKTIATRVDNVQQDGMGSKGWKRLGNAQDASKRY